MTRRSLDQLARHINYLARESGDLRKEMCQLLAEAMERVPHETGMSFAKWAAEKIRRPDGKPYATPTLYSMAHQGRDPERITRHRAQTREAMRLQANRATGNVATLAIEEQVGFLMRAWHSASPAARKQFLERIGVVASEPVTLDAEEFAR